MFVLITVAPDFPAASYATKILTTADSFYFRIPRLWNVLPIIDLPFLPYYQMQTDQFLWDHFKTTFDTDNN